ncbi:VOC family protein [Actinophytocola algeriensis]|uniref:Putative pterin-4-alpha-carbinolamine dehydratase n=1 Tax=Actinophytocola algeriensis TaxID=1768010 RepID=A0A7W7Q8C4_9PSEU|nr:VOC family protein [Actinophytocola algeriensis]MBB4908945.1 4a-hydroxytetrahydrobiopterin dehydratase [Actinophytocola algeriensis]MBE1474667.1 4a-hydroxytetrahydrobiopterin dehydratase [Actinophytocola algeriensis]
MTTLTGRQIAEADLAGWAYLLGGLQTRVRTGDFATGVALVAAVGTVAGDHGPALDVRPGHVDVRVTSHRERGITADEVRLARAITEVAEGAGLTLDSAAVSRLELALDTPDQTAVLPFWAAVFAMAPGDGEVLDPADRLPAVWFQGSGSEEPRQRWHPDVWVEPAQVQPRIDAALAAGGTLVSDEAAPSYWVLADPEGNRVCLCTWQDRR